MFLEVVFLVLLWINGRIGDGDGMLFTAPFVVNIT